MRFLILSLFLISISISANAQNLPKVEREFRAVWIATVDNIDFPSAKNLTIEQQKAEIIKDLELAKSLKMNAVVFQVRPMCDALYESKIEPWSEFLTGEMGKAQAFDPLKFITEEAHKRGILVHAWFNPYRAYHPAAKTVSENHITKTRPDLVRKYGKYLWLDPSDAEVQAYSLSVVADVVKRYDIDGVHFDDYFYPYAEKDANGNKIEFPDDKNWQKYLATAQKLSTEKSRRIPLKRDAWRRSNVNQFIEAVGREIKKIKPEIMYGISPIGVSEVNKNELYADAESWLANGTIDYFVPQLYWKSDRPQREFPLLLKYWESVNPKNRHVWAGIGTYKNPEQNRKFQRERDYKANQLHSRDSKNKRKYSIQLQIRAKRFRQNPNRSARKILQPRCCNPCVAVDKISETARAESLDFKRCEICEGKLDGKRREKSVLVRRLRKRQNGLELFDSARFAKIDRALGGQKNRANCCEKRR